MAHGFETFWAAFPRKVGKLAAQQAWNRLRPDVGQVLETLAWQRETDQWKRGFIPHPVTWIRQGRWLDEPDTPETTPWTCLHTPHCGSAWQCDLNTKLEAARTRKHA